MMQTRNFGSYLLILSVSLILSILVFSSIICFSLFTERSGGNKVTQGDRRSYKYKFLHVNPEKNEIEPGVVNIYRVLDSDEYIFDHSKENEYTLISNFDSKEYVCTGKCVCENSENDERKSTTSNVISKSLLYLVASVSSAFAIKKATEYFQGECEERLRNELGCDQGSVVHAEVNSCDDTEEGISIGELFQREDQTSKKEKEERLKNTNYKRDKYWCSGECFMHNMWLEPLLDVVFDEENGQANMEKYLGPDWQDDETTTYNDQFNIINIPEFGAKPVFVHLNKKREWCNTLKLEKEIYYHYELDRQDVVISEFYTDKLGRSVEEWFYQNDLRFYCLALSPMPKHIDEELLKEFRLFRPDFENTMSTTFKYDDELPLPYCEPSNGNIVCRKIS